MQDFSPGGLSWLRLFIGALFLIPLGSRLIQTQKTWTAKKIGLWWGQQALLAVLGRCLYSLLSTQSLTSISAYEANLISSLLPVFSLLVALILLEHVPKRSTSIFGLLASLTVFFALFKSNSGSLSGAWQGYLEMSFAMIFFAVFLHLYKQWFVGQSVWQVLFAQYLLASLFLVAFAGEAVGVLIELSLRSWVDLFFFTTACGVLPYMLAHIAMRECTPFVVGAVSVMSPCIIYFFQGLSRVGEMSFQFLVFAVIACGFSLMTLWSEHRSRSLSLKILHKERGLQL